MKEPKKKKISEKVYLKALEDMIDNWIRTDMVKATTTYQNWQHDKGSFAYGWIMGVKSIQEKIRVRRDELSD